jgi:hypothetical protein
MAQPPIPIANVLPAAAALTLKRAAQVPIEPNDPLSRVKAIDRAIRQVRLQYPRFFQQEI